MITSPSSGSRQDLARDVGQLFLASFEGARAPSEVLEAIRRQRIAGVVLFRHRNMGTLADLRALTDDLQHATTSSGQPGLQPDLLIAADQEGGQLMAVGDATPFPGNLALGAARSTDLARRTGLALGRELRALGITVDLAPVCDVNSNPANPVVGTRSFGEDSALVADLAAAMVRGLQDGGVAAVAKHFPGHGDTAADSHHGLTSVAHPVERLEAVEFAPFKAAIQAGVTMIMTAHVAVPALDDGRIRPATVSKPLLRGVLRERLGFDGVIVSDAMDMQAIRQDDGALVDSLAALAGGIDLLLFNLDARARDAAYRAVLHAADRGLLSQEDIRTSARRIWGLRLALQDRRIAGLQDLNASPSCNGLDLVRCRDHLTLAREVADRSITLVKDDARRIPLDLPPSAHIAVVVPQPRDLTPADTSSLVTPSLASALRAFHPNTAEISVSPDPSPADIAAVLDRARNADLVLTGTINATEFRAQAALVNALCDRHAAVIAVALRMPYDLAVYPRVRTYVCSYGILPPSMEALAAALWGRIRMAGRLPVSIPGLYPLGHGLHA